MRNLCGVGLHYRKDEGRGAVPRDDAGSRRRRARFYVTSPQPQASLAVVAHRVDTGHELAAQATFLACVALLSALRHCSQLSFRFEQTLGCTAKLRGISRLELASLMPASWNQIVLWLQAVDGLRAAALIESSETSAG